MKKNDSSSDELTVKIKALELQEAVQMVEFKKRVQEFKQSVSPSALVATAYTGLKQNKKVQGNILDNSAGMAAGWLVRKLLSPKSGGILKRVSGYLLQYAATKFITKKMPAIREKVHLNGFLK